MQYGVCGDPKMAVNAAQTGYDYVELKIAINTNSGYDYMELKNSD